MLIERLESFEEFLVGADYNLLLFFYSVTHLSTDIKWLIFPLNVIMDNIDKKYECSESN